MQKGFQAEKMGFRGGPFRVLLGGSSYPNYIVMNLVEVTVIFGLLSKLPVITWDGSVRIESLIGAAMRQTA